MATRIYVDTASGFEPALREEWMDEGACQGKDFTQWFPDTKREAADAKEFCTLHCKARLKCLAFIMDKEKPTVLEDGTKRKPLRFGIYGGLDPKERKALQDLMDKAKEGKAA